jgi:hypothetical protein
MPQGQPGFGAAPAGAGFAPGFQQGPPGAYGAPSTAGTFTTSGGHGGRIIFGGDGAGLFKTYLLYYGLPLLGVWVVLFGGSFVARAAGETAGGVISLLMAMQAMIAFAAAVLFFLHKYNQFFWSNVMIEGKRCHYQGNMAGMFSALAVPYLLTAVTCGIYGPWLYGAYKRYVYGYVDVQGERLQFNSDPAALLGIYIIGYLLTMITFGIYAPWWLNNIYEWEWNGTSISGRQFRFNKDAAGLLGTWIINALLTGMTFGVYAPWMMCNVLKWEMKHVG